MEHEVSQRATESDFDFLNKKAETTKKPSINFSKFLNVSKNTMMAAGIALAVGVTGVGGYKMYQSNIDSKLVKAETIVNASSSTKIIDFIGKEKLANEKMYINNQMLISQFGKYKEVIEVLNKQSDVLNFQNKNTSTYNTISQSLNNDILAVNKLYSVDLKSRDAKIAEFLDTDHVQVAKKWQDAIVTNQFVHMGNIMNLNKQIQGSIDNFEQVRKDIVENVQSRIKAGDFDLNAAQAEFSGNLQKQTQAQLNELNQAKKDLAELKNQSVENEDGSITRADPNAQNVITDKDINEAQSALNDYQTQAVNQIGSDRAKVDQLIAEAKAQQAQTAQVANQNQPAQTTKVVHEHHGPSFLDYYLMYSWMNAVSSNTVHHTTINNYPSGNSTYKTTAPTYKQVNIPKPNMYDMNNNNSYLNKQLEKRATFGSPTTNGTGSTFGKPSALQKIQQVEKAKFNIAEIRSKIETSKAKVQQAKSIRSMELSKLNTAKANKYEAMAAKSKSNSTSNSGKSSFSPSKSSGSSFGKSSGSFGRSGGGSFGGSR